MFGPSKPVIGKCNAVLRIADDYGDNHATMRCQLNPGHDGPHMEVWRNGSCQVNWDGNDEEQDAAEAAVEDFEPYDEFPDGSLVRRVDQP